MTNIERTGILRVKLKPLYENLLKNVTEFDYDKSTFCMQWGANFPFEEHCGIMFVGRATNGWITNSKDINILFGESKDAVFNRPDQLRWVEDHWRTDKPKEYDTNSSAFWRVCRSVAKYFYPDHWYSNVAWSNVCKVAPYDGGNPNNALYDAQLAMSKEILEKEIEILSPKVIVLLTGYSWARDFITHLNKGEKPCTIEQQKWDKYECKVYDIKGTTFIITEHPQGKKEYEHIKCLRSLIEKYRHF